jgi:hypothetical protein
MLKKKNCSTHLSKAEPFVFRSWTRTYMLTLKTLYCKVCSIDENYMFAFFLLFDPSLT